MPKLSYLCTAIHLAPSLELICLEKCLNLPSLKFLTSNKETPALTRVNQEFNFPFPLPILAPTIFLLSGKCGNALNHNFLEVLSDLRALFFKINFILNIFWDVSIVFCVRTSAEVPKTNGRKRNFEPQILLRLKIPLWLNLRGLNNNYRVQLAKQPVSEK